MEPVSASRAPEEPSGGARAGSDKAAEAAAPHNIFLLCNGLHYDATDDEVRDEALPEGVRAAQVARVRADCENSVPSSIRALPRDHLKRALAFALASPVPAWLFLHLWRNGIGAVCFRFQVENERVMVQALQQHAADLNELETAPHISMALVERTLKRLVRKPSVPRLADDVAAGPLPCQAMLSIALMRGDEVLQECCKRVPVTGWSDGRFKGRLHFKAKVHARLEQKFLAPADAEVPFAVKCVVSASPASDADVVTTCIGFTPALSVPCGTCGGTMQSFLYFPTSPSWRTWRRKTDLTVYGANASHQPPSVIKSCVCARCDGCGATARGMKLCSGCRARYFCSRDCLRAAWRQHKQACRASAGVMAQILDESEAELLRFATQECLGRTGSKGR